MTTHEARELFAYCVWANGRVFDAAEALEPDQLTTPVASSFPTVLATLGHIVAAEWVWLRHWRGQSPRAMPTWVSESKLPELRGQLATVQAERDQYLASLSDADLALPVEYRSLAGQTYSDPLAALMRHQLNHSTYHRGQVATLLRHFGKIPPATDLIAYMRRPK
jgi:uncharacterized damage-inducible protein DinB